MSFEVFTIVTLYARVVTHVQDKNERPLATAVHLERYYSYNNWVKTNNTN